MAMAAKRTFESQPAVRVDAYFGSNWGMVVPQVYIHQVLGSSHLIFSVTMLYESCGRKRYENGSIRHE